MKTKWERVGEMGVDAGLCWVGDPCYVVAKDSSHVFESWSSFCDQIGNADVKQFDFGKTNSGLGVCVSTGWGDGCYPVFVKRDVETGRIAEVRVKFM